mgnify:CR=1 FL=1|jgi:hypothetical protein|tara:strand:- start:104 stop:283 length:180 start_codon:yes stop_codon:yes gene_type:complete
MKDFKQLRKEVSEELQKEMMTTADVSLPPTAMNLKNKRKSNVLTRNYIEVMGKRKKRVL